MVWVDYGGQDVTGYDYIGTDTLRYPLTDGRDVKETVEEIRRRCGRISSYAARSFRIKRS